MSSPLSGRPFTARLQAQQSAKEGNQLSWQFGVSRLTSAACC